MLACAILLVEENEEAYTSPSNIISDLGYTVNTAHDGPAALELSKGNLYRLALLDDKMPGMDGVELYGHLQQVQADTVDVLATTFAADATIQEAVRAGIRRVLPKPVDFGHLIPLIEEVAGTL
jgi:CheY-like chemotaxis protein